MRGYPVPIPHPLDAFGSSASRPSAPRTPCLRHLGFDDRHVPPNTLFGPLLARLWRRRWVSGIFAGSDRSIIKCQRQTSHNDNQYITAYNTNKSIALPVCAVAYHDGSSMDNGQYHKVHISRLKHHHLELIGMQQTYTASAGVSKRKLSYRRGTARRALSTETV